MTSNTSSKPFFAGYGTLAGTIVLYLVYIATIIVTSPDVWVEVGIDSILLLLVTSGLVWLNIRKSPTPVKQVVFAILWLVYAVMMLLFKLEGESIGFSFQVYYIGRRIFAFVMILVAAILPLMIKHNPQASIARISKVALWVAVLLIDFAIASPHLYFMERSHTEHYYSMPDDWQVGDDVSEYLIRDYGLYYLLSRVDKDDEFFRGEKFYKGEDYIVNATTQDTLWIKPHYTQPVADKELKITHSSFARYDLWQNIKRLFGRRARWATND
ncbi:MAG: hypothetical protein E7131_03625 [Rikenellaceae bacterium]|nr:hypothetical protein [Rikenellaceae bacterium]